jgi:hypothetical protein
VTSFQLGSDNNVAVSLSVHEHAAIAAAFALEFGRELSSFPELVEAWEDDAAGHDVQAFNRHSDLSFSAEPLVGREVRSKACDVLPNTYGDTLFMTVEPNSLNLLRVEFMGGQAPRSEYASYADQILPWLREHVSKCEGMAVKEWRHSIPFGTSCNNAPRMLPFSTCCA